MTRITYIRTSDSAAYEIEADRFGSYTIRQGGKVVKRVTALSEYIGKPRWGSKRLQRNALEDAKAAIESLAR